MFSKELTGVDPTQILYCLYYLQEAKDYPIVVSQLSYLSVTHEILTQCIEALEQRLPLLPPEDNTTKGMNVLYASLVDIDKDVTDAICTIRQRQPFTFEDCRQCKEVAEHTIRSLFDAFGKAYVCSQP